MDKSLHPSWGYLLGGKCFQILFSRLPLCPRGRYLHSCFPPSIPTRSTRCFCDWQRLETLIGSCRTSGWVNTPTDQESCGCFLRLPAPLQHQVSLSSVLANCSRPGIKKDDKAFLVCWGLSPLCTETPKSQELPQSPSNLTSLLNREQVRTKLFHRLSCSRFSKRMRHSLGLLAHDT